MKKLLIQAFDEPNHTQTPNKFFDMIPDMSEAELRVTLVMIRHTLGYHKSTFKLGMKKLGEESGLTRQGAISGAEAAEQRGIFKRSNPDSQKEAEWELILLPVNVDDMSSRITPSVNVDDTTCNLGLQQVGVKENYKENKEISFFSDEEKAQNEAKMQALLEAERLAQEAKNKGHAWRGREFLPAHYLPYGDWWHAKTGLHMYGAKAKAKTDAEWTNACKALWENEVTPAALDAAWKAEEWRAAKMTKLSQIVPAAKLAQAAGAVVEQAKPKAKVFNPADEPVKNNIPAPERRR